MKDVNCLQAAQTQSLLEERARHGELGKEGLPHCLHGPHNSHRCSGFGLVPVCLPRSGSNCCYLHHVLIHTALVPRFLQQIPSTWQLGRIACST